MKKKLLVILLALVMVASLITAVSCNKSGVTIDLVIDGWFDKDAEGSEDPDAQAAYKPSVKDGVLTVDYESVGEWQVMQLATTKFELSDLEKITALELTASADKDTRIMLKIEYLGSSDNYIECYADLKTTEASYTFDLSKAINLSKSLRISLFIEPGKIANEGSVVFKSLKLVEKATADFEKGEATIAALGEENVITSTDKKIGNWYDWKQEAYTITENNGVYTVNYQKVGEWNTLQAVVTGEAITSMKSLKIKLGGLTVGEKVIIKLDAKEKTFDVTAAEQEFILDIVGVENASKVGIIMAPGNASAKGSFTIINAEFSIDKAPEEPVIKDDINNITETNGAITKYEESLFYTTSEKDGIVTVTYSNKDIYETLKAKLSGAVSSYTVFKVTIKGNVGDTFMIKSNIAQNEATFTLEQEQQELTLALAKGDIQWVGIIAAPGTVVAQGSFQIIEAKLANEEVVDPDMNTITAQNTAITKWMSTSVYTVTENDGVITVAYNKGTWDTLEAKVEGTLTSMASIKIKLKGTVGDKFLIKYENKDLKEVTLESEEQEFILAINATLESTRVGIIPAPNVETEGTFQIISASFSTDKAPVEPEEPKDDVNEITASNGAITKWTQTAIYTVAEGEGVITVTYTNKGEWDTLQAKLSGAISSYNALKITVKGNVGDTFMIKTNKGSAGVDEKVFTLTATEEELTLNIVNKDIEWVGIIPQQGTANVSGTFQIVKAELANEEPVTNPNLNTITADNTKITKWYGDDVYAITPGEGNVTVERTGHGWQQIKADFTGAEIANMSTLKITLNGVNGIGFTINAIMGSPEVCYDGRENGNAVPTQDEVEVTLTLNTTDVDLTKTYTLIMFVNVLDNGPETCTFTLTAEFAAAAAQ